MMFLFLNISRLTNGAYWFDVGREMPHDEMLIHMESPLLSEHETMAGTISEFLVYVG